MLFMYLIFGRAKKNIQYKSDGQQKRLKSVGWVYLHLLKTLPSGKFPVPGKEDAVLSGVCPRVKTWDRGASNTDNVQG